MLLSSMQIKIMVTICICLSDMIFLTCSLHEFHVFLLKLNYYSSFFFHDHAMMDVLAK